MNIEEYISSGILESYALGAVSPQEKQEVECMAHIYPEIKAELDALTQSMDAYASLFEQSPPKDLRAKIWAELKDIPQSEIEVYEEAPTIDMRTGRGNFLPLALAACVSLLIAFGIYTLNLSGQLEQREEQIASLNKEKESIEGNLAEVREMSEQHLAIVKDPQNKIVHLTEPDNKPDAHILVYWNPESKETYVLTNLCEVPSQERQYQLWAIVNGEAVDAGVFEAEPKSSSLQAVKMVENADAFVVTLEKRGGVPVAEGEIYMIGGA